VHRSYTQVVGQEEEQPQVYEDAQIRFLPQGGQPRGRPICSLDTPETVQADHAQQEQGGCPRLRWTYGAGRLVSPAWTAKGGKGVNTEDASGHRGGVIVDAQNGLALTPQKGVIVDAPKRGYRRTQKGDAVMRARALLGSFQSDKRSRRDGLRLGRSGRFLFPQHTSARRKTRVRQDGKRATTFSMS
jgi:hypothetical protein